MTKRLAPTDRKKAILTVAVNLAKDHGYQNITREHIAEGANCSTGLVSKYFSTMSQLKRSVMRAAIKEEILQIIAQGLVVNDPNAKKAPDELKRRAIDVFAV